MKRTLAYNRYPLVICALGLLLGGLHSLFQLHQTPADTWTAAYLIARVLIGLLVFKKVKSMDDYYLGGRSFGPLVLMATVCATIIGGSGLMGRAGVAYSSGFKAIMTALPYLLGMFIFSGLAGRISDVGTKFGVTSIPELFEQRFGKTAKVVLGCLIAFTMMGTVASQVTATATIINMLGGEIGISYELGALIACAVFIIFFFKAEDGIRDYVR